MIERQRARWLAGRVERRRERREVRGSEDRGERIIGGGDEGTERDGRLRDGRRQQQVVDAPELRRLACVGLDPAPGGGIGRAGDQAPELGERPGQGFDLVRGDRATDRARAFVELGGDAAGPEGEEPRSPFGIAESGGVGGLDVVAERLEDLDGVANGGDAVGVRVDDGAVERGVVGIEADAQPAGGRGELGGVRAQRRRRRIWIARLHAGEDIEHRRGVAHRAGDDVLVHEATVDVADVRCEGNAAAGGLEAEQAAARGGDADRTAAVVRMRDRHEARGSGAGRAAARATGGALRVVRVARWRPRGRFSGREDAELGGVGLADDDEACALELRDEVRVLRDLVAGVLQRLDAARVERTTNRGAEILDQDRHAAERAGRRGLGIGARLIVERDDHGAELRVVLLDARDRKVHELARRSFTRANELGTCGRIQIRDLHAATLPTKRTRT